MAGGGGDSVESWQGEEGAVQSFSSKVCDSCHMYCSFDFSSRYVY